MSNEVSMRVRADYHKYVIGTNGKHIREVSAKCQERFKVPVTIEAQQQNHKVIIRSSLQTACDYAASLVDSHLVSIVGVRGLPYFNHPQIR